MKESFIFVLFLCHLCLHLNILLFNTKRRVQHFRIFNSKLFWTIIIYFHTGLVHIFYSSLSCSFSFFFPSLLTPRMRQTCHLKPALTIFFNDMKRKLFTKPPKYHQQIVLFHYHSSFTHLALLLPCPFTPPLPQ